MAAARTLRMRLTAVEAALTVVAGRNTNKRVECGSPAPAFTVVAIQTA